MAARPLEADAKCELVTVAAIGHGLAGADQELVRSLDGRAASFLVSYLHSGRTRSHRPEARRKEGANFIQRRTK